MADVVTRRAEFSAIPEPVQAAFLRALRASEFVARQLEMAGEVHWTWLREGGLARAWGAEEVRAEIEAALAGAEPTGFAACLRQARNAQMTRIAIRALSGWAPLAETLAAVTAVAEVAIQHAHAQARRQLEGRYGQPRHHDGSPASLIVFGMGKLGGGELNFSSDVDLIFGYTDNGETDGAATLENAEFFSRLAQDICRLLGERSAHGFVFRTDTLLRPFGRSGAVAMSVSALENYYQAHGRDWERYAWIKARPIAGDIIAGEGLLKHLRPFVYRRYLDYDAIAALRELKGKIAGEVSRTEREDDIKIGMGGIREIEFVVQVFQLIRGGQLPTLRSPQLFVALHALESTGYLSAATADTLRLGYDLLRRVENALQMYADEQVHRLPREREAQEALCSAMEVADWPTLLMRIQDMRERVHRIFTEVFAPGAEAAPSDAIDKALAYVWSEQPDTEAAQANLREAQYSQAPEQVVQALQSVRSRVRHSVSEATQRRMGQLLALLLADAAQQKDPESAALRCLEVISSIAGRTTYLSLLLQYPSARQLLVRCCAASPWIAELLARAPALLDALLFPDALTPPDDPQGLRTDLQQALSDHDPQDIEMTMEVLRRFQQENALAVAIAQLDRRLDLSGVCACLSATAEAILELALRRAWMQLAEQYGEPGDAAASAPRAIVVGYGKLGAHELNYTSDLDIVFIFDLADPEVVTHGGGRSLSGFEFYQRLAQRVVQLLTAVTARGRAYVIDLALRPSGNSGLVVSSFSAFARYQRESAWTWEHQALTRARVVAGDVHVGGQLASLRREVLCRERAQDPLRKEICEMRERMAATQQKRRDHWDVKLAGGGLVDIEFIVQYLVLAFAGRYPQLTESTETQAQLRLLRDAGLLDARAERDLWRCSRLYRAWQGRRALQRQDGLAHDSAFRVARLRVRRHWQHIMESG